MPAIDISAPACCPTDKPHTPGCNASYWRDALARRLEHATSPSLSPRSLALSGLSLTLHNALSSSRALSAAWRGGHAYVNAGTMTDARGGNPQVFRLYTRCPLCIEADALCQPCRDMDGRARYYQVPRGASGV